jgi:hypothetical protein
MLAVADAVEESAAEPPSRKPRGPSKEVILEAFLVAVSPLVLFFVLRLRAMAPGVMPDPAMHTAYIVDPRDFFARFSSELVVVEGSREGARVGFLVPARLLYLWLGAVRAFFAFRYLLALVAVVPSYVLLRRLYCRAAGAVAIVILMSSPVLVTAWGTDYPDSAVVSYLTGALACLAMPCPERRRRIWLVVSAILFTMAVWSNVAAAPLVAATMIVYLAIRLVRDRRRLLVDTLVIGAVAAVVTGALMLASGLMFGPFDYILATLRAFTYLNRPALVHRYHSSNRRWILLRPYLLVPVGVVGAWGATFLGRLRRLPTPQLLVGTACAAQVAVFGYLQFLGGAEVLQQHYYSSSIWAAICLALAVTVSAVAKPLLEHGVRQWLPATLALALPLAYETDPNLPAFGWLPAGLTIVGAMIIAAAIGRRVARAKRSMSPAVAAAAAAAMVVIVGSSLILTVAPYQHHAPLQGVVANPVPAYATALGGSDGDLIDQYRVATELPLFVGNSTYPAERLMMWFPDDQLLPLTEVLGMYHANINELTSTPPRFTVNDKKLLAARKPAEILVLDAANFPATLRALAPYDPRLLRATVLRSGDFAVHAWLIALGAYMR